MLKKLLNWLGYIPKKDYQELNNSLEESNKDLKKCTDSLDDQSRQIALLKKQLKHSIELNEEYILEISSHKSYNNSLDQKNKRLEKSLKETKRKEGVLLRKQGKLKEQLAEREVSLIDLITENHYLKQKVKLLESYNYAVISKLEELCFGSVLPKVMKQMDLSKYLYPLKPIKIMWSKENGDIKVEAIGVKEINEKVS